MPVGNSTWKGLGMGLWGEYELNQAATGSDILTITRLTGGTDDFLVFRDDGGAEKAYFESTGDLVITDRYFNLGTGTVTTAPTTGLVKGDIMVVWSSATHPVLGACVSTATQLVQYIAGFNAGTLGIAS